MTTSTPAHLRPASILLVVAGGLPGAAARAAIERALPVSDHSYPWATFVINLAGAFILGCLLEALIRARQDAAWRTPVRLALGTGFCGAFTTYSTLAMESVLLARHGSWWTGAIYVVASVVGGLVMASAGIGLSAAWKRRDEA